MLRPNSSPKGLLNAFGSPDTRGKLPQPVPRAARGWCSKRCALGENAHSFAMHCCLLQALVICRPSESQIILPDVMIGSITRVPMNRFTNPEHRTIEIHSDLRIYG